MYNWQTPTRYIKGLGPVRVKELASMKIHTVGDLLEYKPLDYIYPGLTKIVDLPIEGNVLINGIVKEIRHLRNNVVGAIISDETGECAARWYGSVWLLNNIHAGTTLTLWGKVNRRVLHQPKFATTSFNPDEIVGGQYGVHSVTIRQALKEVFRDLEIPNWVMPLQWPRRDAFEELHSPATNDCVKAGLERLKFDECLLMQLALELRRKQSRQKTSFRIPTKRGELDPRITKYFSFKFTKEQWFAIEHILQDIDSIEPMSRLLHGEVGSGKTAVAFYAAMFTALNGKRALILCPTTILAIQHYETLKGMGWEGVGLWISNLQQVFPDLPIVIGTTAILANEELLCSASLVIVDEQHKFGVHQRALLQKHGNPHVLLMSATPIPRTLAMTVFGDLDISTIRELPIKRGTVVTKWILPGKREQMYELIEKELKDGHQAYVVYPRIESGDEDVENAMDGFNEIMDRFDCPCHLLTGNADNEVKARNLQEFKSGKCKILVSTIIAEVGLDCPNATVMVIEGADRFGLSQLHQLRGRVCRSTATSFCFLVAETANETSIARLNVMEQTNDGFEIAEHDLRLRGPGEIFSIRQHGLPNLKFVDIIDDYELMVSARSLARELVDKLDLPEYAGLKQMLEIKYKDTLKLSGVA